MADNPPVPVKEEKGEDMIPSHQAAWSPEYKEMFAFWSEERGDGVIREGDKIILKTAEGKLLFARARTGKKLKMGRSTYVADKLIGKPYGQSLEVARGDFNVVTDKKEMVDVDESKGGKSNEKLVDRNSNQKLSQDDIEKLKRKVTGEEMVKTIVSNSATFKGKTVYSQAKYLKRKRNKFLGHLSVLPASGMLVCAAYLQNWPGRSLRLRPDTLATMLTAANVRAHSRTLICDDTFGVVTAAVLERQGGFGKVLFAFTGERPKTEAVGFCNLSSRMTEIFLTFPLAVPRELNEQRRRDAAKAAEVAARKDEKTPEREGSARKSLFDDMGGPIGSTGIEEKKSRLYARAFEELQISCNSLIIASRFDTKAILRDLLPYVAGSSAIVVYSEAIDPLKDAINFLKTTGQAVNCNICENWFREYQILPKRTHPMMNMNGMGGYILTAIKIAHPADIPAKAESFGLV